MWLCLLIRINIFFWRSSSEQSLAVRTSSAQACAMMCGCVSSICLPHSNFLHVSYECVSTDATWPSRCLMISCYLTHYMTHKHLPYVMALMWRWSVGWSGGFWVSYACYNLSQVPLVFNHHTTLPRCEKIAYVWYIHVGCACNRVIPVGLDSW